MKQVANFYSALCLTLGGLLLIYIVAPCLAVALESTNYKFIETSLGGVGLLDTQSANYQATGSGAVLGIGNQVGTAFQFNAGHLTTGDPALSFAITDATADFGPFSAAVATTSTTTFEVINYTSYGYIVQVYGNPPRNGSFEIDAMSSTGPSQTGTEQYGINLVANTSPVSLGANPDNGQFGNGAASTNYDTPNNYRYVSGETVANAPEPSGKTIYTISYIINAAALTPGGQYTANQTIIVTGTY